MSGIEPTWYRGMYGCPEDMFGRSAVDALLAAEHERIAAMLSEQAVLRFDAAGPHDERGAAFWDAASYVREDIARTPPI